MDMRALKYGATIFGALPLVLLIGACSPTPLPETKARDPGVRDNRVAGAGNSYTGLPDSFQKIFAAGQEEFARPDEVAVDGLGPRMNLDSCLGCHSQPAPGGSSPAINPQFVFWKDSLNHNTNKLPSFITEKGPAREARFKQIPYPDDPKKAGPRWRCPRSVHHCRNEGRGELQVRTA